jgi:hypothetical protein
VQFFSAYIFCAYILHIHSHQTTQPLTSTTSAGPSGTADQSFIPGAYNLNASTTPKGKSNDGPAKLSRLERSILAYTGRTEEGLQALQDEVFEAGDNVIEHGRYHTRKHHANTKHKYKLFIKYKGTPQEHENPWAHDVLHKHAGGYMPFHASLLPALIPNKNSPRLNLLLGVGVAKLKP